MSPGDNLAHEGSLSRSPQRPPGATHGGSARSDARFISSANRDGGSLLAFDVKSSRDVSPQATIAGSKQRRGDLRVRAGSKRQSHADRDHRRHPHRTRNSGRHGDRRARSSLRREHGSRSILALKGANGNVAPILSISGSNTQLSRPFALAFDGRGDMLVADERSGILAFTKGAAGNAIPVAQITGLDYPAGARQRHRPGAHLSTGASGCNRPRASAFRRAIASSCGFRSTST